MWSWWSLVHISSSNRSTISCNFNQLIHLIGWTDILLSYIFNKNTSFLIWSNFEIHLILIKEIT
jgi:hypothetical protein